VFYLEGPDGGTTAALRAAGLGSAQLFTVNHFAETCAALRRPPHALLHATVGAAETALSRPPLAAVPFASFYLDACSGCPAPLIAMVEAIFHSRRRHVNPHRLAIGFTLTRAEPTGRSLGDREQEVLRALAANARANGYGAPIHALDEPARWGLAEVGKEEGGTLTTWVLCDRLDSWAGGEPARVARE